jgi:ligand-binding sensor domain-containing protein/putative methionine-R-sulfoxide reductase with GAF domain/two-component sensor histidine kinase
VFYRPVRLLVVIAALFAGLVPVRAQLPDYYVKMLTEQQGLNPSEFIGIAKDQQGFLWLLSQNNVQRYDGKQSWSFPVSEGADQIFIDKQDRKWLITRAGVKLFVNDYRGFASIRYATGKNKTPVSLFNAWNGLYLLLSDGFQVFDENTKAFIQAPIPLLKITANITIANSTHEEYLFFATADSIYSLEWTTKRLRSLPVRRATTLVPLSGSDVLVSATGLQTFCADFEATTIRPINGVETGRSGNNKFIQIYSGVKMKQDLFLLSSSRGLIEYEYCQGKFKSPAFYYKGDVLSNTLSVRRLFKDGNGVVYMTHADGVAFCNPLKKGINYLRYYTKDNIALPEIDIRSFAEDKKGTLWMATLNGLANLDMQTGDLRIFFAGNDAHSINYPSLRHLVYHHDLLWVGTAGKGVWLYQTETGQFRRPHFANDSIGRSTEHTFTQEFTWKIVPLANGNVFIAGGNYCYTVNCQTLQVTRLSKTVFRDISRSAVQDSSGRIWRGTHNGMICVDSTFRLLFTIRDSFPDKRIASLCEWKANSMLVGSKGVYEVQTDRNKITSFKQVDWMPANRFVYCMEKDALGKIWLGTDEGLYCHNPTTGKTDKYDGADNVQPQSFNSNGLYMAKNGLLFAGGKSGMNYFDPLRFQSDAIKLTPSIASFAIDGDDSTFFRDQTLEIPFADRNISVNISAPDYQRPFRIQYRYTLNSKKNKWIHNGNSRYVQLNNLSPGKYQLIASVSHDGVQWFDAEKPVDFTILLPWWKQWWFVTLVLMAAAGSVWILYSLRQKRKRRKRYQQTIDYFAHSGFEHSTVDDILWDVARNCISGLGFEDCVIYLLDPERNVLIQKAAYGAKSPRHFEIVNPIEIPVGKGITGHVASTGVAEIIGDTTRDKRYVVDDEMRCSEITVPIIHQGKVIGIIDAESKKKYFFTKDHLETLITIASICSAKISRGMAVAEMKKAEQHLAVLNTKMLETKFMNLRLQMNPHFLFNSLNSIQHLIVSQQTNEAYKYLSVFSAFLRSVLQYTDKTVIKLEEELKMLDMYIRLELLGSDKAFDYSIEIDEQLEPEDILIPPLIIQPLVENAIWHGLMHKEGARLLTITFKNSIDEHMVCTVDDNGIGRAQASSIGKNNLNNFAYQSKSTALIKERLRLLEIKTGKPANIEVEDKHSEGRSTGTSIKVIIPFYNIDEV